MLPVIYIHESIGWWLQPGLFFFMDIFICCRGEVCTKTCGGGESVEKPKVPVGFYEKSDENEVRNVEIL
ncbi:hypothetical protein AN964_02295 [Heyndrickxia shackletonii]|uniref:Uncharacterized protein n=1 Tax=Heyndrickxia shackletonii TaxID=157838 RepID=A0A0Q3WV24_9BACI|nr:hypothetical protein AN964_02295 [Heyndrickxia shackletonii]